MITDMALFADFLRHGFIEDPASNTYATAPLFDIKNLFQGEACAENDEPCFVLDQGKYYYTRAGLIRLQRMVSNILNTRNSWSRRTTNTLLAAAAPLLPTSSGQLLIQM